jgi:hypothetical protein
MRNLVINVYPRPNAVNANGQIDNSYVFNSLDTLQNQITPDSPYQFIAANLNYSLVSSAVTSLMILSMDEPPDQSNVLRSGQPVEITDNGDIVFQGVLLTCKYQLIPMTENSRMGGIYLIATLAPSIFQLTSTPVLFDNNQALQMQQLTGINIQAVLAGGVVQNITSQSLINYMISNTDYSSFFNQNVNVSDLSNSVFIMASSGQSRDSVLRASIDFNNVVLYQSENGIINIRQLDSTIAAPFNVDLTNQFNDTETNDTTPTVPLLEYEYGDNAALTPSVVSNYNMLSPSLGVALNVNTNLLSYTPNPQFYPRINQLATTGWFTGLLGTTQINENIITDPTVAEVISGYLAYPDKYMLSSKQFGAQESATASYQALLTAKELAASLNDYATLQGLISLDDPNISIQQNMGSVLGTIIKIQSCDMQSGIIATCTRSYSTAGSYLNFNATPLGSITGYWKS